MARSIIVTGSRFGRITATSIVCGAGSFSTLLASGLVTVGASTGIAFPGSTSGTATVKAPATTGSAAITLPNASSTLPIFGQQITFAGPTAARTVTFPDANFTAARTNAANTFIGNQTFGPGYSISSSYIAVTTSGGTTRANLQATNANELEIRNAANSAAGSFTALNGTLSGTLAVAGKSTVTGLATGLATKTSNYTATATDHKILCDTRSGSFSITLPTAVSISGTEYLIKDKFLSSATFPIIILCNGSETIDGQASAVISNNGASLSITSDGQNWYII